MPEDHDDIAHAGIAVDEDSQPSSPDEKTRLTMPTGKDRKMPRVVRDHLFRSEIGDSDPAWEVIDEGGGGARSETFNDEDEAIDVEVVTTPPFTSPQGSAPAASLSHLPAPSLPRHGAEQPPQLQPEIDRPMSQLTSPSHDSEASTDRVVFEELLITQPNDDDPPPTPLPRRARECQAEEDGKTQSSQTFVKRKPPDAKFQLKDGSTLHSTIQREGARVSAKVVRWALWKIEYHYKHRGLYYRRPRIPRVQHLVVKFAEVLASHELKHPGLSPVDLRIEALQALFAVLDGLDNFAGNPE